MYVCLIGPHDVRNAPLNAALKYQKRHLQRGTRRENQKKMTRQHNFTNYWAEARQHYNCVLYSVQRGRSPCALHCALYSILPLCPTLCALQHSADLHYIVLSTALLLSATLCSLECVGSTF